MYYEFNGTQTGVMALVVGSTTQSYLDIKNTQSSYKRFSHAKVQNQSYTNDCYLCGNKKHMGKDVIDNCTI